MKMKWDTVLTPAGIDAYHVLTEALDPAFAHKERKWYESRDHDELAALAKGAWDSNNKTTYVLAKSYIARLRRLK